MHTRTHTHTHTVPVLHVYFMVRIQRIPYRRNAVVVKPNEIDGSRYLHVEAWLPLLFFSPLKAGFFSYNLFCQICLYTSSVYRKGVKPGGVCAV